ncbi:GNAT family N-acetyltransferase [Actinoalloteichus caeruleus]|uniref:GNAT family N-acetyltransferase n=1 Tax=Actinoalloteichus cyanogriseus TaxID=2893586 RepID=UPI0004ABA857|nr:GNAT family N-acetyltransferase [Actinoalloteichus caeruleus]
MAEVTYRPYRESDAPRVKAMINEAFHIHRYAGTPRLLRHALEIYLRQCLVASTYTRVAVLDGRAVGIVMGRVEGHPPFARRARDRLRLAGHAAMIALTGFGHYRSLGQYFTFARTYAGLRRDAGGTLGDELTLFVVDSATRGTGVGKQLLTHFTDHLRASGRDDYHLFTDSLCTYEFYERRGLHRAHERTMPLALEGLPSSVGVFIYTGTATAPGAGRDAKR